MSLPEVGQRLHARYEDGEFYTAEVVSVAPKKKAAPVKVSFKGYDGEKWLGLGDLKCKALGLTGEGSSGGKKKGDAAPKAKAKGKAKAETKAPVGGGVALAVGKQVEARYEKSGEFYAAQVLEVSVRVSFKGWGGEAVWVNLNAVKDAAAGKSVAAPSEQSLPEIGQTLSARYSDDKFYMAEVVQVSESAKRKKAPVKVSFKGYQGEESWVSLGDIKCKALGLKGDGNVKKPDAAPKAKAKAAPKGKAKAKAEEAGGKAAGKGTPVVPLLPKIGQALHARADDGEFYPAQVVEVSKKYKGTPVKVTFNGWQSEGVWLGARDLKCKSLGLTGQPVRRA